MRCDRAGEFRTRALIKCAPQEAAKRAQEAATRPEVLRQTGEVLRQTGRGEKRFSSD